MLRLRGAPACLRRKWRALADFKTFAGWVSGLRQIEWMTYAKRPFGGPEPVLAYLSRYTHRIAISNRRLVAWDDTGVTFKWKDYRLEGPDRYKTMTLVVGEFIRSIPSCSSGSTRTGAASTNSSARAACCVSWRP